MRIFLAYTPSGNFSVPNSNTWYKNLYAPLIDLGHEVFTLRLDEVAEKYQVKFRGKGFKETFTSELERIFLLEHKKKPFDLFFAYLTIQDIYPSVVDNIRKLGIPTLNFSCNNTHQFDLVEGISNSFDFNLYSEKDAVKKFNGIDANSIWFPMAANPTYYYPLNVDYKYDVSFIGAAYAKRAYYIHSLVENGVEIDCFGPNWLVNRPNIGLKKIKKEGLRLSKVLQALFTISPEQRLNLSNEIYNYDLLLHTRQLNEGRMHYPCSDEELISIISKSKINLGFLEVFSGIGQYKVQQHLHLREFEIPMCGGLYLTNYSDELGEFYDIGKEVIVFRNEHELLEKVDYYLTHEHSANLVRKAAYERAIKCHTYHERFRTLFKQLNLG